MNETPEDCKAPGFSGEGRCLEPAVQDGLCAGHLPQAEEPQRFPWEEPLKPEPPEVTP